jgi:hypothetical protein
MKNLFILFSALLFLSCANEEAKEAVAEAETPAKERSIGFNTFLPELKWHLGTDAAIQTVKDVDELWSSKNYEAMKPMMADTAKFYFADGREAMSPDDFIKILAEDDSDDTWSFNYAYSVDLDPETGGEHVQAGFTGYAVSDGDTTKTYYHESYYIIQGKIITWNQLTRKPMKE